MATRPKFFRTPSDFRAWLDANHTIAAELIIGFYKKGSGKPSITWPESVDEALCVGWIDGIRKRIDAVSYTIRFTPRRKGSVWSAINIARVTVLTADGRMRAAGLAAFERRQPRKSGIYSYEQRGDRLGEPYQSRLRRHKAAWAFVQAQPPSYRKLVHWWIMSAKQEETRLKRLAKLIEASSHGKRL